ncbi:MAG: hypothetical protein AAGA96_16195 [Verrucomicrobiota bacterium]
MIAYLLSTGENISPFNRPPGELKIHQRSLLETQQSRLKACRCNELRPIKSLEEVREFPCLVISDDLYFTRIALRKFLRAATKSRDGNYQAALETSNLTETFTPAFQGNKKDSLRCYDLFYLGKAVTNEDALRIESKPLPIPHRIRTLRTPVSRFFDESGQFEVPLSGVFLTPIRHWSCLLTASLLGMTGFLLETARTRFLESLMLLIKAPFRAGSLRLSLILGKCFYRGRKCRIHPTAEVIGSILGDNVQIGPNAVVKNCVIGSHTRIGPAALVEGCSIGERCNIAGAIRVRSCVLGNEATIGTYFTQFSILGNGAMVCPDAGILDFSFKGDVQVKIGGKKVNTGSRILGGCLGDGVFLGPGLRVMAGQEVPEGAVLVTSPRELVRDPDSKLPDGVWRIDSGRRSATAARDDSMIQPDDPETSSRQFE